MKKRILFASSSPRPGWAGQIWQARSKLFKVNMFSFRAMAARNKAGTLQATKKPGG